MMVFRVIASLVLIASITLGSVPVMGRQDTFASASFDSYEVTLVNGESLKMRLSDGRILFSSSVDQKYYVTLSKAKNNRQIKTFTVSGSSFNVNVGNFMDEDILYDVTISYEAYGMEVNSGDNIIFKRGDDIYFWENSNYEYNLGTCAELWTDEQSLKECLEPQNDIECDDPVLIGYSDRICEGAKDDWEKAFRIYKFISSEMAYDQKATEDASAGLQDSAVDVIRSGKAVCEGFSNAFAALCTTRKPTSGDLADHAWAAVFLGGEWRFLDPTYDMSRFYHGPGDLRVYEESTRYYLLPLESFSNDHRIMDADTVHGIVSAGYCGDYATYEITRDGVCYISGEGTIKMPPGVNGFSKVVFDPDSNITVIDSECFCDCDLITVVILPDSVKRIESLAFNTCEDLEYIYLPEGLEFIGQEAFECCDELCYVRVPDSCYTIEAWAFDVDPRLYLSLPSQFSNIDSDYDVKPMYIEYR